MLNASHAGVLFVSTTVLSSVTVAVEPATVIVSVDIDVIEVVTVCVVEVVTVTVCTRVDGPKGVVESSNE